MMMSEYDRSRITKAEEIAYWSVLEKDYKHIACFIENTGLKQTIGWLNDHHIEIASIYEDHSETCNSLYDIYNFDLMIQKIKNKIGAYSVTNPDIISLRNFEIGLVVKVD